MNSWSLVPPTEDTVQTLVNHLVNAFLPDRSSKHESPSPSLQLSIANQMHAVVLLYNYYHRKQHPQLEFLDFESFCKVSVNANPSMLVFLNYMQKCNDKGQDGNLSITEEAILDACNISISLHALKETPYIEGWPISKIAVLLTDSKIENCFLHLNARTQGVWSLIEINGTECGTESEIMFKGKKETEKWRDTKNPVRFLNYDETRLQQLAVSAVKEATGIHPTEITILESHITYSLSEDETTSCLFIVKCTSVSKDVFQVPIKDVIDSLQGPLVKKSCNTCTVTNSIKYFNLLPYAGLIKDWFSREMLVNGSEILQNGNIDKYASAMNVEPLTTIKAENISRCFDTGQKADYLDPMTNSTDSLDKKGNSDLCVSGSLNMNDGKSSEFAHTNEDKNTPLKFLVENGARKLCTESDIRTTTNGTIEKDDWIHPVRDVCNNENVNTTVSGGNNICTADFSGQDSVPISNYQLLSSKDHSVESMVDPLTDACDESIHGNINGVQYTDSNGFSGPDSALRDHLVPFKSDSQDIDKTEAILTKKGDKVFGASLGDLLKKRMELYHQQRQVEDDIAQCESDLQTILRGENDFMSEIETVTENLDAACLRDANGTPEEQRFGCEDVHPLKCVKRKRSAEAILQLSNPCQVLDEICLENNWILPRYIVSPSSGGFRSSVKVRGVDFKCSGGGEVRGNAREARESAASHLLSKLHSILRRAH